jgi:hypothetical protein
VVVTAIATPQKEFLMNRTIKALTAALLTLGLAVVGLPLGGLGGGGVTTNVGSSGCCKQ